MTLVASRECGRRHRKTHSRIAHRVESLRSSQSDQLLPARSTCLGESLENSRCHTTKPTSLEMVSGGTIQHPSAMVAHRRICSDRTVASHLAVALHQVVAPIPIGTTMGNLPMSPRPNLLIVPVMRPPSPASRATIRSRCAPSLPHCEPAIHPAAPFTASSLTAARIPLRNGRSARVTPDPVATNVRLEPPSSRA
jgi:hypothetical protein